MVCGYKQGGKGMLGICIGVVLFVMVCILMKKEDTQNKYALEARRKKAIQYRNMGAFLMTICLVTFAYGAFKMILGPRVTADLGSEQWIHQFNASYDYGESLFRMWPFIMLVFGVTGGFGQYFWNKYKTLKAGLYGEELVSDTLNSLPEEYTVYNNIPIEKDGRQTEIDSLIISKYGIFLGEVKNYKGRIIGDENDSTWTQIKKSAAGELYENSIKNPIKQAKFQTYLLSSVFREKGLNCYIDPYVVFVGSDSVNTDSDMVLRSQNEFYNEIMSHHDIKISRDNMNKIKGLIECLTK